MMAGTYQVNPDCHVQVTTVGHEEIPVIVIDDFLLSLDTIRDAAEQGQYHGDDTFYPGVRKPLPDDYVNTVLKAVSTGIRKVYRIHQQRQMVTQRYDFSLITKAEQQLLAKQRIPHFDTDNIHYFAILHYLNEPPHGNTGLFRHKDTGYERIYGQRSERYFAHLKQHYQQFGAPQARYCRASNEVFELYHEIEYKANRLVIYPGHILHSTLVDMRTDINDEPSCGRLTSNIFIEFQ